MKKLGLLGTSALSSAAIVGMSFGFATPAAAQAPAATATTSQRDCPAGTSPTTGSDTTAGTATTGQRDNCLSGEVELKSGSNTNAPGNTSDQIVVTGTRIARPNLTSTVPINSVNGEEFFQQGKVAIGDVINQLPQLRSTFNQSNSTRFLGTAGLAVLDLRGLGTQRTLVLVNGRRHVAGDILNTATSVDVNTIPTDLIDRIDIVTGGNSAVYGSDAIAGVVNFVLKQHFDGVQLRGQGGVSRYGDAGSYFASLLVGRNFAGDRGNVAVNFEYARQNQYFGSGRPNLAQNDNFVVVDTDPPIVAPGQTLPNFDGNPDRVFFRDIRSATLTNTGLVRFGGNSLLNCGTDPVGNFYNCPYMFTPTGQLVPVTGTRVGLGPNGSFIGGNGENFRGGDQFQVVPQLDRYNVNAIGHFTVSDAFEPFFEAKYARTDVYGSGSSGPAFITGTTLGDAREQPRLSNPYLDPTARALIIQQRTLSGLSTGTTTRFALRENLLGLGVRAEESKRETWRGVVGIRGNFLGDWKYELSANYGEFKEKTQVLGNLNVQRFLLAMDAVRDPATGNIVCNAQINPAAAVGYAGVNPTPDQGTILQNDIAKCIPVNPFGGNFTQAQRDYLLANTTSVGKITQFDVMGYVAGNTGRFFRLPGGPIDFSVGGEYRRETNYFKEDPLVENFYTFYNSIPTFTAPAFEVKEAFGEVRLPILKDVPFFQELTVAAAGRVSNYKGKAGTVYAYNVGGDWAPVKDLRFRANYARAVRAPNLGEIYSPAGQNFAPGFVDPCSARNIGTGTQYRAANCAAAGAPAGYDFVYSQSLEIRSGGNPNLQAEKSDSYTIGGVFTPRWVPGLSISVDYYNIIVKNVIESLSAQTIANQCYDSPTLNNPYCALFQRAGAGGGPRGEVPFQILEGSLLQSSLNYAKLQARGVDVEVAYRHKVEGFGTLTGRLVYTHVIQRDNYLDPTDPKRATQQLLVLGDPQDRFNFDIGLKTGPYTFGYRARYIGKMLVTGAAYEDFFSKQGRPPQNADFADRTFNPSVLYHDARIGIDATDKFNFYLGVDNITNRNPPLGLTGIGGGSGIYDVRGRFFYAGATAKF